jgi:hypothetical protein
LKRYYAALFSAALALALVSCKSAPKEEKTEPAPVPETKTEEPAVQPAEPAQPVKADNTADLEKAEAARKAALDAGADSAEAAQFAATDALYASLKAASDAGGDAAAGLQDVTARYNALEDYAKALKIKSRIDENNYSSYDAADYDKAEKALADLRTLFADPSATGKNMFAKADTAYASYMKVLNAAFRKLAQDERAAAFVSKRNADSVKAGVAQKDAYDKSVQEFRDGDASYSMQDAESAYGHYQTAHQSFDTLYNDISAKRAAAQKAIDDAKKKAAESSEYAAAADKEAPLEGDDIKGIEKHDAVLLEQQTYEDPDKAVADIPETITADSGSSAKEEAK